MKKTLSFLLGLPLLTAVSLAGNWFGSGPWANGTYYPGQLNGKYQGVVTGPNISGVLGFALFDGAPPFREVETQQADFFVVARNVEVGVDPFQNYFSIFVEGRLYNGLTTAAINTSDKTVSGTLQGTDPVATPAITFTNITVGSIVTTNTQVESVETGLPDSNGNYTRILVTNVTLVTTPIEATLPDPLIIINRGLSGAFQANIKQDKAVFTFSGQGQLSTPANPQSFTAVTTNFAGTTAPPPGSFPGTNIFGAQAGGQYTTASTAFTVSGIKTSFFSTNAASTAPQR
jgi:hypothetical protein